MRKTVDRLFGAGIGVVLTFLLALVPGSAQAQEARVGSMVGIAAAQDIRFPDLAYDAAADAYLAVWSVANQPPGARFVAADGTPLSTSVAITTKAALSVGVACGVQGGTDTCLAAWLEERAVTNPPAVMGRLLRYSAGSVSFVGSPFVISQNGLDKQGEHDPAVAYSTTSNEFLVAWVDAGPDVKAQRVTAAGTLAGSVIAVAASGLWEGLPSLTYNSVQNEFLVAYWYETNVNNVGVQRVAAGTGALVGTTTTVMSSIFDNYPEVAYNSATNQYLVTTWGQIPQWVIHGRLLDGNGQPVGSSTTVLAALGGGPQTGLAYSAGANRYFAAYQHHDYNDTWGVGVAADGTPATPIQVTYPNVTRQSYEIAVAGSTASARWLTASSDYLVTRGQLVSASGAPPPPPPTCSVTATATAATLAVAGNAVAFASTATPSNCGTATPTYSWNFGDSSSTGTTQNPSHTYASAGTYTWTLTVQVGTATATKTGSIQILAPGTCIPSTASVLAKPAGSSLVAMWQSTGVTVTAGQLLTITTAGSQTWVNGGQSYTAAGNTGDVLSGTNVPMPGAPRMALVGRIGATGTPFLVGAASQFTPGVSGLLYLAPNDEWYMTWDNSGSLTASICLGGTACSVDASTSVPTTASVGTPVAFASTGTPSGCGSATPAYSWNFGDGTAISALQNPSHTYAAAGTFTWTLTVQAGTATTTKTGSITILGAGVCVPSTATIVANPSNSSPSLVAMWQATGVTATSGQLLTVSIGGSQTWINGGQPYTAAGNAGDVISGADVPMPGAPRMALVGRIGASGTPFLVGTFSQFTAGATGQLYLAPNDHWYLLEDNSGSLSVSICTGGTACAVDATATVPSTAAPGAAVAFAATCSPSGCGAATPTYSWNFGDASGASTAQNPTHTYANAGAYTWTLTVKVATVTTTRTGTITVQVPTCTPSTAVVLAGPAASWAAIWQSSGVTVTAGQTVTLTVAGSQTWTSNGQAYTAAGNAGSIASGADVPMAGVARMALVGRIGASGTPFLVGTSLQFTAAVTGVLYFAPNYEWYLLGQNSGSLSVSVCAGSATCSVGATATVPTTATVGSAVAFAATATPSSCGTVTPAFSWNFGDGSAASTAQNPTHAYVSAGVYTWTLTVQAGTATTTRTGTVTVGTAPTCTPITAVVLAGPAASPTAIWQSSGITVTAGQAVTITVAGSQTWTSNGQAFTAAGNAGSIASGADVPMAGAARMALIGRIGASGTPFLVGASLQFTAAATGVLHFAPNHEWYLLWQNSGSLSVSVCTGTATCSVGATTTVPTTATVGVSVQFASTATPSACGTVTPTYSWDFGDGSSDSAAQNPTHIYAAAGTFTWTLTVQAGTATTTRTGTVTVGTAPTCATTTSVVAAAPTSSPTAIWQSAGTSVAAGQAVTITVAGSQTWTSNGQTFTAAGNAGAIVSDPNVPLSGAPRMALIGRIGTSGAPFVVGTSKQLTAGATGTLYFAPNHEWYLLWQNSGSLTVSICK